MASRCLSLVFLLMAPLTHVSGTAAPAQEDSGSADSSQIYVGGKAETGTGTYSLGTSATDGRTGINSDAARTSPSDEVGLPFDSNLDQSWSSSSAMASAGTAGAAAMASSYGSGGCTSNGFQCIFPDDSISTEGFLKIGDTATIYKPEQFQWKAVDPMDYTVTDWKDKQTLNCKLPLANTNDKRLFYVKTGAENVNSDGSQSTDYCDIEQVRRTITQDNEMIDEIRLRAETGRLDKSSDATTQASFDLIGEQYDLRCACRTNLDVEESVTISYSGDMTVITADDQTRDLPITLMLFQDDGLSTKVTLDSNAKYQWPADTASTLYQFFYFLAKHNEIADWDVMLQITDCVACKTAGASCTTRTQSTDSVMFYSNCVTIAGGPQRTEIKSDSWFFVNTATVPTDVGVTKVNSNEWSDSKPTKCPFDALGIQKFRISTADEFAVKCRITACLERPCNPCNIDPHTSLSKNEFDTSTYETKTDSANTDVSTDTEGATKTDGSNRRQLFKSQRSRRLQDGDAMGNTELGVAIKLPSSAVGGSSSSSNNGSSGSSSSKKKAVNVLLILVILLLAVLSMAQIRRTMKKNAADNKAKVVQPANETASEAAGRAQA